MGRLGVGRHGSTPAASLESGDSKLIEMISSNLGTISEVLSHYPVGRLERAERADGGMMNENWLVHTERGTYFLRRRDPFFGPASIDFELQLIDRLTGSGFPTAPLVRSTEECLKVHSGESFWELYEYIPGDHFDPTSIEHVRSAARLLARFHRETAGWGAEAASIPYRTLDAKSIDGLIREFEDRFRYEIEARAGALGAFCAPAFRRFFSSQAEKVLAGIRPLEACPLVLIHGDFQPSNIIFRGDGASILLDFGNAALSYRAYDVAKALLRFSILSPGYRRQTDMEPAIDPVRARAFMEAYQEETPLSDPGLSALTAILRGVYLFSLAFYLVRETGAQSRMRLLIHAARFIRWLDGKASLEEILDSGQIERPPSSRQTI